MEENINKSLKEAMLYEKLEQGKVRCSLCRHYCSIAPGRRGICGVRENREGVLVALNYGKTIALNIDPIEKKPLYHFMPGTRTYSFAAPGCNFHCLWCQNWEISQSPKPDKPIAGETILPEEHVESAFEYLCPSISYTYSEPTIFAEYALDTMKIAREKGLRNIWVTNGYMSREALEVLMPYMDAANVDLKCGDDQTYRKYCGGTGTGVMDTLKTLHRAGVHVEVTTLIVTGVNDRPEDFETIASFIAREMSPEVPWHISRFFPAWKMADTPPTPLEVLEQARETGRRSGLKKIHLGNV